MDFPIHLPILCSTSVISGIFFTNCLLVLLVTWVVLIASRDGFFNPLKPNSQDYHITAAKVGVFRIYTSLFW
jgi:hypothetical protein